MSLVPGQIVGEYRILEQIGSGAFGTVFRVEHIVTLRQEALKVLGGTAPPTDEQRKRFLREIQLQARLSHPNIASVHNAFWHEDSMVMIMELVDGESLQRILERGRMARKEGLACIRQVLTALSYAHAQGVVHRDVSPANIIVARGGKVKLTDFGLAKAPLDARVTATGTLVGSPHYMSPEQVRGANRTDPRMDIYSCGAILYEILTGRKLFDYESAFALLRAHLEEAPVPPCQVDPDIPEALSSVIMHALAKDPRARFASADAFRKALERAAAPDRDLAPEPLPKPQPPPPGAWRGAPRWLSAAKWVGAAAGGVIMALACMAGMRWMVQAALPVPVSPSALPPQAQQVTDRVIGDVRMLVHSLPALPWTAPPGPPAPEPPPVDRRAKKKTQGRLQAAKARPAPPPAEETAAPSTQHPPPQPSGPLGSILQALANLQILKPAAAPAEPAPGPTRKGGAEKPAAEGGADTRQ